MSGENDLIKLYSARILALAADIPTPVTIENAAARVKRRSPLCGSTVTVEVDVDGDILTTLGQDVKACALGQAAAAVAGAAAPGKTLAQITKGRDQLRDMLKGKGPVPDAPFDGFEVLTPATGYKNRHASIMLSMEAIVQAMEEANAHAKVERI